MNNCATGEILAGGRPALVRSRSQAFNPARVAARLPAEPVALAPTSNRKKPQEGHYIRTVESKAKRRNNQRQQRQTMNDSEQWQQHRAFGAVDWAALSDCREFFPKSPCSKLPIENESGTKPWPVLKSCVTAPRRISDTLVIFQASGVCTVKFYPYDSCEGADVMAGRDSRKR